MAIAAPIVLRGMQPAQDLFVRALRTAWTQEWPIFDPDIAQEFDIAVWEKVNLDGKVTQAIEQRLAVVAAKGYIVDPGDDDEPSKKLADIVEAAIKQIRKFREGRRFLAEGIFRARSFVWLEGRRMTWRPSSSYPTGQWWLPTRLKHKDKREVRWHPVVKRKIVDGEQRKQIFRRREVYDINTGKWLGLPTVLDALLLEVIYRDESGRLGFGRGLLEPIYFLWWAKQTVMKEGLQGIEKWAQGKIIGKVDTSKTGSATASGDNKSTVAMRNQMRLELDRMRSRHIGVFDKADEIMNLAGGGEGWQIVLEFLKYCDDAILGVALGGVLPFGGASDKGSLARAGVEKDSSEELLDFDRGLVDEPINDKLIPAFLNFNTENIAGLGLADAAKPVFKTSRNKLQDPEQQVKIITEALRGGIDLKKQQVYERIDFDMPSEDDEIFEGAEQLVGAGAGGFGGGGFGGGGELGGGRNR